MPHEPPVLRRLKELGMSQRAIATALGASTAAVSKWCAGTHPFGEPWSIEAQAVLAVLSEHVEQGGAAETITFAPTVHMNVGGITQTGNIELPMEALHELAKLQDAVAGLPPAIQWAAFNRFHMCSAITMLAERIGTDPLTWNPSAHELDTIYKAVEALRLSVLNLLRIKADAVMSELTAKERDDANETA